MKQLLQVDNKRGVSVIVSYALLIIIAVGVSIGVYSFLKVYVPSFKTPECPNDISIIANELVCDFSAKTLSFDVTNKGLFSIDAAYVRFRKPNTNIATIIDEYEGAAGQLSSGLPPGISESFSYIDIIDMDEEGNYTLEVQPVVYTDEGYEALCNEITKKVECKTPSP